MKSNLHIPILFFVCALVACARPAPSAPTAFHKWQSEQVLDTFRKAGLDVMPARLGKGADDGLALGLVVQTLRFRVTFEGKQAIGYILSFTKEEDMDSSLNFFVGFSNTIQENDAWVFIKDNIVVEMDNSIPEPLARRFQAALQSLR